MYRFRLLFWIVFWMSLLGGVLVSAALAQEDEDSPFRPGLVASYSAGGGAGGAEARRIDEVVAFDWQEAAPDPSGPQGSSCAGSRRVRAAVRPIRPAPVSVRPATRAIAHADTQPEPFDGA